MRSEVERVRDDDPGRPPSDRPKGEPEAEGFGTAGDDELTETAGRGAMALAVAKLYFIVAGWAVYFLLPRILDAAQWGDYLLIVGLASVVNNVMVGGTVQSISRFTAQREGAAAQVRWAGVRMQAMLGVGSAVLFALGGVALSFWWKDPGLVPLFGLMSAMVVLYSFYSVFVGSANGTRSFVKQATLDMGYSTIKVVLVLGLAWAFSSSTGRVGTGGALAGLVISALSVLVISIALVGRPSREEPIVEVRPLIRYALALFLFTFLLNLVMRVDLILIKRMALTFGQAAQATGAEAAAHASRLAGRYGTAQVFAFVVMQVLLSVAFVIFPLVSRSTFEQDDRATRIYIRQTLRVSLMVAVGLSAMLAAKPAAIIDVVYQGSYRIGGLALRNLSWGVGCLAMTIIGCTILNGAGKTRRAIATMLATVVLSASANAIALSTAETGAQALYRSGLATAAAMGVGAVIASIFVWRTFGALMDGLSGVRILGAGAATFVAGNYVPEGGVLLTLAQCVLMLLFYAALLIFSREVGKDDWRRILTILGR
jgi:stage V sporulation protein B